MTQRQLKALAAYSVSGLTDGEIGKSFGVSRTAIANRRRRALDSMAPAQRQRYLEMFPPRRGRPRKRRRRP